MKKINEIADRLNSGLFLETREELLVDQKQWYELDEAKTFDFNQHPYWITTDDGVTPVGFDDLNDIPAEFFK